MYKVIIERECGCIRRANMPIESSFADKDNALIEAGELARKMKDDVGGKHSVAVQQEGENFLITMQMRG